MSPTIEVRAFMDLAALFRERNWPSPLEVEIEGAMNGVQLLAMLEIPPEKVEVVFVNGKASTPDRAVMTGGDRVALVPPGVPGPYRALLGFKKMGWRLPTRGNMAYAEYLVGMAFNHSSLGHVHAAALHLSNFHVLPHGVCNSILLARVEDFNPIAKADRSFDMIKRWAKA